MDRIKAFLKVIFTYGLVVGLFAFGIFWLFKNPIYNPIGPQMQPPVSQIDVKFKDVVVRGRKNGIAYWSLKAKTVESERGTSRVFFKDNPTGEFYNLKDWSKNIENDNDSANSTKKDRNRTFTWKAESAECNIDTEDLILKNKVRVKTDDNDTVETDELIWLNTQEKVISNKRTKILASKGSPEIKADHVEGNVKLDLLALKGNVEITTDITEEQQL